MEIWYTFIKSIVNTGANFVSSFCHALSKHDKLKSVLQEDYSMMFQITSPTLVNFIFYSYNPAIQ